MFYYLSYYHLLCCLTMLSIQCFCTVSSPHVTPLTFVGPMGFPGGPMVKKLPAKAGHTGIMGLILGSRRSPGERNSNSFQYSCLGNPTDRGAWQTTVHGVAEWDTTQRLNDNRALLLTPSWSLSSIQVLKLYSTTYLHEDERNKILHTEIFSQLKSYFFSPSPDFKRI